LEQSGIAELERLAHKMDYRTRKHGRLRKSGSNGGRRRYPMNYRAKKWRAGKVPGCFFIGEVVDVTGHLGGFNFQWALVIRRGRGKSI